MESEHERHRAELVRLADPSFSDFVAAQATRRGIEAEEPWRREWAEFDPVRKRLVWTAGCILFAAIISRDGPGTANLLLNTLDMRFEPRQAPY